MGLLRKAFWLSSRLRRRRPSAQPIAGLRVCRFEQMERRQLLAVTPIQLGAVYYEDATGEDRGGGDRIEITWSGGAPGTQLAQLAIHTDKLGDGLTIGDVFFDTAPGGQGAFLSIPLVVIGRTGIDSVEAQVADGGTTLLFTFSGFDPGEKLVFTVDVDEMGFLGANAVAEGNEFEGSRLSATFTAPHFHDAAGADMFLDFYDSKLAASGLPLPPDNYMPPAGEPRPVNTAGAVFPLEQVPLPITLSGTVFEDIDLDNALDPADRGIPGVQLELLRLEGGQYVGTGKTTVTDADGRYRFEGVAPGTYRVVESQPGGYLSVGARAGTVGGQTRGTVLNADVIDGISLQGGEDSTGNDFAEALPVRIGGRVVADMNGNNLFDPGDRLLSGVTVELLDEAGHVLRTTQTDGWGNYEFTGLAPGAYGLHEVQPEGYFDGPDRVGSAGGTLEPPDAIIGIRLPSGASGERYDFFEILPCGLSGHVYADDNGNGRRDPGETPVAGVLVTLLDASGNPTSRTAVTDAQGFYQFDELEPGVYGVAEAQPGGYLDGLDAAGTAGGSAHNPGDSITGAQLLPGTKGENYDFGELRPASVEGMVWADRDDNGMPDPGEAPIGGVTLHLIDTTGRRVARVTTDGNGRYVFRDLAPGTYGIDEDQPAGYLDGKDRVGTAGGALDGNDRIRQITLAPGADAREYDFGELPPARISGYVFQDGPVISYDHGTQPPDPYSVRDGRFTPDDRPLAGVLLTLADEFGRAVPGADGRPRTAVTDAYGYYAFEGLAPGTYVLLETQPEGFADGNDTAGSIGGLAVNPSLSREQMDMVQGVLAVDPRNDAIVWIPVMAGDDAVSYNFSEARLQETPVVPPPEPPQRPDLRLPHELPQPFSEERPYLAGPGEGLGLPDLVPLYGGVGIPPAYTWHLSVVNAGRPRRDHEGNEETVFVPAAWASAAVWSGEGIDQGRWTLAGPDGSPLRTFQFGVPGARPVTGDFNGDGITEIGVYSGGAWFADLNGNGRWDEQDLWAKLGTRSDKPVTGDWDGDAKTDIGIFGPKWSGDPRAMSYEPGLPDAANRRPPQVAGRYKNIPPDPHQATSGLRALRRTAIGKLRKDLIDHVFEYGSETDRPVAGDWNGDGVSNIGVFRDGAWYLDLDGDGRWSAADQVIEFGQPGDLPVVGDWNGDGADKLGVYRQGTFYLDVNGDRVLDDRDKAIRLGGPDSLPVAGDWNGDGADEVGVFDPVPAAPGPPPAAEGQPAPQE